MEIKVLAKKYYILHILGTQSLCDHSDADLYLEGQVDAAGEVG